VIIEEKAPQVLGSQVNEVVDLSQSSYWRNKEYMQTQRKVITSVALAHHVADKLQLHNNPSFWGSKPGKPATRTVDAAATLLSGLITATPTRDSNILEIAVEHPDASSRPGLPTL